MQRNNTHLRKEVSRMDGYVIETDGLTKTYANQTVVKRISLHVRPGRIYGLLGRNGAGKTTIMKMILGLVSASAGTIRVFGQDIVGNEKEIYPRIGSIIESPGFYSHLTGVENLKVFARIRGTVRKDAVRHALGVVNLSNDDKKPFGKYSMGMKQRLGIANAILNDPELLVLDEPTNGLDPIGIAEIREFIRAMSAEKGKTVLISSHILSEISLLADDIGIIHEGNLLVEKSMEELRWENSVYLQIRVSSPEAAARVLESVLGIKGFRVEAENIVRVYDMDATPATINRALLENGVEVKELRTRNDSLEDYFKRITGGEGIA